MISAVALLSIAGAQRRATDWGHLAVAGTLAAAAFAGAACGRLLRTGLSESGDSAGPG